MYGSVVECLTRDRRAVGSSLTGVTALLSLSKNINPSLVLVQPRKTCPFITERVLMGSKRIKSNKNKLSAYASFLEYNMKIIFCYCRDFEEAFSPVIVVTQFKHILLQAVKSLFGIVSI